MKGRTPKFPENRSNRARLVGEWREFPDVPFEDAPPLGRRPGGGKWPEPTRRWWEALSSMPHCSDWHPDVWEQARMAALLHASAVEKPSAALFGELRRAERVLGVGEDGRRSLRIRYVSPSVEVETPTRRGHPGLRLVDEQ